MSEPEPCEPYPCPLCRATAVVRSRLSARMTCGACGWEFAPPHRPGGWTPGVVIEVWEAASREYDPDDAQTEAALRETLAEVLGEFGILDPARGKWHAPGLVDDVTMRRWRGAAGLETEETTDAP
jgi:ribosomal protein L37AE/L43A